MHWGISPHPPKNAVRAVKSRERVPKAHKWQLRIEQSGKLLYLVDVEEANADLTPMIDRRVQLTDRGGACVWAPEPTDAAKLRERDRAQKAAIGASEVK